MKTSLSRIFVLHVRAHELISNKMYCKINEVSAYVITLQRRHQRCDRHRPQQLANIVANQLILMIIV